MYLDEIKIFTELIRAELCNCKLSSEIAVRIDSKMLQRLYDIASRHDLIHMVAIALKKKGLLNNNSISSAFWKGVTFTLLRYESMQYEYSKICEIFEQEKIMYVPLKGAVINQYYPESWMRTSSDIDILVQKENLERAKDILCKQHGYKVVKNNYHDIAMVSPGQILLELHFTITENEDGIDRLLSKVWDYVYPVKEGGYQYAMTSEYLIFHVVAHMLYHFINGGCGVRFLLDLWILEQRLEYDKETLNEFFRICGILKFANYAEMLASVWFERKKHDEVTMQMQQYIIEGGLFGNVETKVRARRTQIDGQFRYVLSRIFQSYDELKMVNPVLNNYPMLYPYYLVRRWFKIFDKDEAVRVRKEIKVHTEMREQSIGELKQLFLKLKI